MFLEVEVHLNGVNAPNAILLDGTLEHARIIRHHQPQVRPAWVFAKAKPLNWIG